MATSTNANHCSCYKTLCVEKRTRSGCVCCGRESEVAGNEAVKFEKGEMRRRKQVKLSIDKFRNPQSWLNNCCEQWYWRVFRLCVGVLLWKQSIARKRATTKYSTAKFNQPKQNMAAPMRWDKTCEKYEWNNVEKPQSCMTQSHSTITIAMLMVGRWRY